MEQRFRVDPTTFDRLVPGPWYQVAKYVTLPGQRGLILRPQCIRKHNIYIGTVSQEKTKNKTIHILKIIYLYEHSLISQTKLFKLHANPPRGRTDPFNIVLLLLLLKQVYFKIAPSIGNKKSYFIHTYYKSLKKRRQSAFVSVVTNIFMITLKILDKRQRSFIRPFIYLKKQFSNVIITNINIDEIAFWR